eukprot:scaffold1189_cov194-Amphora_coffeaeformis.AAC.13
MFDRASLEIPSLALELVGRIGRGGAAAAVSETLLNTTTALQGGWGGGAVVAPEPVVEHFLGFAMPPEGKAVVLMAIAMAFHYFGYSLARPITVALFTSSSTGYAGMPAAFPLAMAFVSPFSLFLLMGYGNILDRSGPAGALVTSTLICAVILSLSAIAIGVFQSTGFMLGGIPAVKLVSGPLFIFRESYVQLLTSQFWSFMASALTPAQSAQWFGPIAGLTSIASAVAGLAVSPMVDKGGLAGVLLCTGLTLIGSVVASKQAYAIADQYGFTPVSGHKKLANGNKKSSHGVFGLFSTARQLFARVPVLGALFTEILASQGLATVLNVCFVSRLESAIPNDSQRAGWVGVFFALINIITMTLQFGILPPLMRVVEPRDVWRVVPLVSLAFTAFQALQVNPSLGVVSASLMVMKVSEYSARRMLDEMVFVPLDFESRFVGKEVIGVFGYRFGKSCMSLALSGLTAVLPTFALKELSVLSSLVSLGWLQTAWRLSNLVPTRAEATQSYAQVKEQEKIKK